MFYGGFIAAIYHGSYMFITTTSKMTQEKSIEYIHCLLM